MQECENKGVAGRAMMEAVENKGAMLGVLQPVRKLRLKRQ
jgi:hypothetical protein